MIKNSYFNKIHFYFFKNIFQELIKYEKNSVNSKIKNIGIGENIN